MTLILRRQQRHETVRTFDHRKTPLPQSRESRLGSHLEFTVPDNLLYSVSVLARGLTRLVDDGPLLLLDLFLLLRLFPLQDLFDPTVSSKGLRERGYTRSSGVRDRPSAVSSSIAILRRGRGRHTEVERGNAARWHSE